MKAKAKEHDYMYCQEDELRLRNKAIRIARKMSYKAKEQGYTYCQEDEL